MLKFIVALTGYLFIVVVCCNYSTSTYTDFDYLFTYGKRSSFNFTIEPSVSVGPVLQFWTNTGLWYVMQFITPDKAHGPDELSAKMLIEASSEIAYPLFLLFKKSLNETSVPADWKSANVTPIFKKRSRKFSGKLQTC